MVERNTHTDSYGWRLATIGRSKMIELVRSISASAAKAFSVPSQK